MSTIFVNFVCVDQKALKFQYESFCKPLLIHASFKKLKVNPFYLLIYLFIFYIFYV